MRLLPLVLLILTGGSPAAAQEDGACGVRLRATVDVGVMQSMRVGRILADRSDPVGGVVDLVSAGTFDIHLRDVTDFDAAAQSDLFRPALGQIFLMDGDARVEPPLAEGLVVTDARPKMDGAGRPAVSLKFDTLSAERINRVTSENIGQLLAFVIDGEEVATATVLEAVGDTILLSGNFTDAEVAEKVATIGYGSLPDAIEVETVEATGTPCD
ncbi:SecDF P1 head subdomain-containing protein [Pelagovum pacificum]|uniref:SecDF P1 head subdomain domain-containing protein n=1 Tax=Pelagovum pacificum TaxID=2588711 RepID=A0A5C5GD55_9RHOB|nr:hypothetical protein [Pelagovum pacificum]QQA44443.1 hypothetical protein I8N54_07700 [Pelagovum pacificum]TNY32440.1 hypothetical protein FHY64_03875 [Pelagovum pacificum]